MHKHPRGGKKNLLHVHLHFWNLADLFQNDFPIECHASVICVVFVDGEKDGEKMQMVSF